MHYVYIIQSASTGSYYIGSTENIGNRLKKHNANSVRSTKHKGPWQLVAVEEFCSKHDALLRERAIKSYKGNSLFKNLVAHASPSSSLV